MNQRNSNAHYRLSTDSIHDRNSRRHSKREDNNEFYDGGRTKKKRKIWFSSPFRSPSCFTPTSFDIEPLLPPVPPHYSESWNSSPTHELWNDSTRTDPVIGYYVPSTPITIKCLWSKSRWIKVERVPRTSSVWCLFQCNLWKLNAERRRWNMCPPVLSYSTLRY